MARVKLAAKAQDFKPKRGRPSLEQAAAISESILAAATEVFLAEGFDCASMDVIAAKARVPKSTLYKRFSDKRTLLRAVLEARVSVWSAVASRKNWLLTDRLDQRLNVYADAILTWSASAEVQAFTRLAASAWSSKADISDRLDVIGYTEMVDVLERDICEFGPKSGARAKDPRRVAEALMAMLFGWLETRGMSVRKPEATAFAKFAVDLLIQGKDAW